MGTLTNAILATIGWLAIFKPSLIRPLFARPVADVLGGLTGTDIVLWLVTFAVVSLVMALFDHYMTRRPTTRDTRMWP